MLSKDAKILVVDDMKMIRKSIIKYLHTLGYDDVVEASNGAEAIAKVRVGSINFVFLDVVMPNITGNETLKKIRELNSDIPIAMVTSVHDDEVIQSCKKLGIVGYILKPLDAKTGPERISTALARVA